MTTPKEAGFRMPPEWAPHAGCWMAWPCRPENWDDIERARATYVEVARAIAAFEPVTMTANAEDAGAARGARSTGVAGADVVVVPSDDSWARDTAPTFVTDGRGGLAGVDWRFNAYGGIYEEYGRTPTWRGASSTWSGRDASPRPSSSRAARCTSTARARC